MISLTVENMTKFQKELDDYAKRIPEKIELFLGRLMEIGIPVVDNGMATSMGDSSPAHSTWVEIQNTGGTIVATLYLSGEDVAFIEFGAGIYYNHEDHPKAGEFGFGIGTYGKGQGLNYGWFYYDDMGNKKFSRGTEMTAPLHSASQEIIRQFRTVALEVFGE